MNTSRRTFLSTSAAVLLAGAVAPWAQADVKLPALVSDNMVLLADTPANVWGKADPLEKVKVTFGNKNAEATADAAGNWNVKLEGLAAGTTGDMTIAGKNSLTVKNVAVGEVWVGSGQSNMEMEVSRAKNAGEEAAAANFPEIRMFTVRKAARLEPQTDCEGKWEVCTPATVPHFSAVGYFFARELNQQLKVPIGVIHSSWGGTPAENWTPEEVLNADPDLARFVRSWDTAKANYPQALEAYNAKLAEWKKQEASAKADGQPAPKAPPAPRGGDNTLGPTTLWNGMINPLLPYTIRGVIWYQGEANAGNAKLYQKLFPTMISAWRDRWNCGEFPFLYVQLASFMARAEQPTESDWAALREAQSMTLELPHTGMALAIDIGEANDIHPKNKQEVGRRLALNALATVYYKEVDYSGPLLSGAQTEEGRIRVTFRHAEGLKTTDGGKPKGFAIAGEDHRFVWGDAEIQGDHVVVSSPEVPKPVAVRYAWANNPEVNLVNASGLPASPFRTDDWTAPPKPVPGQPQQPKPATSAPPTAAPAPAAPANSSK